MGAPLRRHRRFAVLAVVILLLLTVAVGYGMAKTQAAAPSPGEQAAQDLTAMGTPEDGTSQITVDQERGLICIQSRHGRGSGGGCGPASSPDPMVSISGGAAADPAQIVVVDSQRRIGVVRAIVDGDPFEATSQDGGFSVQMTVPQTPDVVTAFDAQGNILYASQPSDASTRANQAAREQSQSDQP